MEGNLIATWFAKLVDALRINKPRLSADKIDAPGDRLVQPLKVAIDGLYIRGRIFFPVEHPSRLYPALIICHGIPAGPQAKSQSDHGYEALALEFNSIGVASVIFNFRGCGDSDGNFHMMGWTRDLEAVTEQMLETPHIDPSRIIILGFSEGGAAAIHVAADNPKIYGLAVAGAPARFDLFKKGPSELVADFRGRGIIRDRDFPHDLDDWYHAFGSIEPRHWISHFKGEYLLIVHGAEDEVIPPDHAQELKELAPAGLAQLSIVPHGLHRLRSDPRCIELIKEWILDILGWKP